jgi:hypothetical protein
VSFLYLFKFGRRGNSLANFGVISPTILLLLVACPSTDPNAKPPLGLIYIRLTQGARTGNDLSGPGWSVFTSGGV